MAAQDQDDTLTSWFMCELCKTPFSDQDQYNLHLESHKDDSDNKELVHTCSITDNVDTADFRCSLCDKQFASICTLHDHISSCFHSGSYIFFHRKRTVYPLSKFCSLYENRGKVRNGCRDDCDKSSLDNSEDITDDTLCDGLEILLQDTEGEDNKCKSGIDSDTINFDIETGAETDKYLSEDLNKTPSIEHEIRPSKKKSNRNQSTGECTEENTKEEVNGTAAVHKELDTEHNQTGGPSTCIKLCKKRGRPRKIENAPSRKIAKKSGGHSREIENEPSGKIAKKSGGHSREIENEPSGKIAKKSGGHSREIENEPSGKIAKKSGGHSREIENVPSGKIAKKRGLTLRRVPCEICGKEYPPSNMKQHMVSHTDERPFVCDLCPKTYKKQYDLTLHRMSHDSVLQIQGPNDRQSSRRQCEICKKVILPGRSMKLHMVSHSDERPFACDLCPKTFKHDSNLILHKKSHDSVLPLYCEVCGKGYIEAGSLRKHLMKHRNERPYSCSQCVASFVDDSTLKRHMTIHTGKKQAQCDKCGKDFATKDRLMSHIRLVHKRELRFQCSDCGQKFFTNYNLKCHTMMHAGIKPHKCSVCSAAFIQRKELRRHMKIKHNLTLETGKLGSDLNYQGTTDSVNEAKTAVANIREACRTVKNVSVSQSTPAVFSTGDNKQGTSRNDSEQFEQLCNPSIVLVKTEPSELCGSGRDSKSEQFVIFPLDSQSGDIVFLSSASDTQIMETEVQSLEDSTLI